jgi:signal transduction histidine kinase
MSWRWAVIPAGIILGLIAETGWPAGIDPRVIVADLAIGWLFIGAGFVVWTSRPANRMGILLIATGASWFVATFATPNYPPAAYLYCGPLVHLLMAHPTGRLGGRASRIVVAATYALSAVTAIIPLAGVGLAIGSMIVAVGIVRLVETATRSSGSTLATYALAVLLGLVLVGASEGRLVGSPVEEAGLFAYQVVLAATVLSLVADVLWRASSPGVLARFVVDLGSAAEAGTLRDRLARAVGDPSLTLGYAVEGGAHGWVDDTGDPIRRPPATADRSVTPIAVGGVELGFVGHDPALVGDRRVFELIASAAGLAISNSATQAEIRRRMAKVDASRERLVHAADAQGRRIESALENGVDARLTRVAELLTSAAIVRPEDAQLGAVLVDLAAARDRLRDFSRGVYPATLTSDGLVGAIQDLAARSRVPVEIARVDSTRYEPAIESTLYFVCSEALANVAKHARASRVTIELGRDATGSVLRIEDDGVGGANVEAGSGLRGLADRVEALGGSFVIDDRSGGGTSVTARVPGTRPVRHLAGSLR